MLDNNENPHILDAVYPWAAGLNNRFVISQFWGLAELTYGILAWAL